EPSHLLFRQASNVATQRINEQSLRQFGKHGFATDVSRSGFFYQVQNGTLQPVPGVIRPAVHLKNRRKFAEDGPADIGVASHVPAHISGSSTAATGLQRTQGARL